MSDGNSAEVEHAEDNDCSSEQRRDVIGLLPLFIVIIIVVLRLSFILCKKDGQKTRTTQQRRMYVGSRARRSLSPDEPTIYVSPANLPPPPKYEAMAPPSYDEVVGVHYPNYQPRPLQPITQPITVALAHSSTSPPLTTNTVNVTTNNVTVIPNNVNTETNNNGEVNNETPAVLTVTSTSSAPSTVITVTSEERTPTVTVASS